MITAAAQQARLSCQHTGAQRQLNFTGWIDDRPYLRAACISLISLGLIGLEQRCAIAHPFSHPVEHHQSLIWHEDSQSIMQDRSFPVGYRDGLPKRRKGGGSR